MYPTCVPTVTGRGKANQFSLSSPTPLRGLPETEHKLIVDCHTYYLKRKWRPTQTRSREDNAFAHYLWFTEFARHNQHPNRVWIAPDCDWVGDRASSIVSVWADLDIPCLVMPSESHFGRIKNVVGHCLRQNHRGPAHPEWTHTFSRPRYKLQGDTKLWTYDSISEVGLCLED